MVYPAIKDKDSNGDGKKRRSSENVGDSRLTNQDRKKTKPSFIQIQEKACDKLEHRVGKCLVCRQKATIQGEGSEERVEECRFLYFRKLRYSDRDLLTVAGFPNSECESDYEIDDLNLWTPYNPPKEMTVDWAKFLIREVGDQFCELVKHEKKTLAQLSQQDIQTITWRRVVPGVRELCDVCSTTLFNYHWTCGKCGFVVCVSCFKARRNTKKDQIIYRPHVGENKDKYGWLRCHTKGEHILEKLLLTQIIAGRALDDLWVQLHKLRRQLDIPEDCSCKHSESVRVTTTTSNMSVSTVSKAPKEQNGKEPEAVANVGPKSLSSMKKFGRLFPNVPHAWLCKGYLLRLLEPSNSGNVEMFLEQWKRGQPVIVSNVGSRLNKKLWTPESFSRDFGQKTNNLINCMTGKVVPNQKMKKFWDGFEHVKQRLRDDKGEPMLLKLKDWPPADDFAKLLPDRFKDLMDALPLGEYTHRDGRLNLAARLPDIFCKPDLGPKMFIAYGSGLHLDKGTTNLHLDVSDAINVMVHVGVVRDDDTTLHDKAVMTAIKDSDCDSATVNRVIKNKELPGALWHIWKAKDADKIRDIMNKHALEKGVKVELHDDPIHDQIWYLDSDLRKRLREEYNVVGYPILQCEGDAIFIPAGAPHQVRNLNNCIKIAEDFVSPENVGHCFCLTEEFRNLTETHMNHEDKLQIKNIVYHTVKDAVAVILAQ